MPSAITGGCLCGAVRFGAEGPSLMGDCHCSICRKWTGTVFLTSLNVSKDKFRFVQGQDEISGYKVHDGNRLFCRTCGSSLPGGPEDGAVGIPAGLLDGDPGTRPVAHIFVASKVPWLEINDGLPRWERYPPGYGPTWAREDPTIDPGPPTNWTLRTDLARGSCLCGSVRYEVEPVPNRFMRCHCSRCRRATGSAYACNLYVAPERFRWTAGSELVKRYDLPEARSFATEFCTLCGSSLPHRTRSGREVVVLTGTLDDDPGIRVEGDLFLEDRAPWMHPEGA